MTATHDDNNLNRDPLSGTPGSHPVGVGVGGAGGAVGGAAIGAFGGPIGMLIGGAVGAIAGALAGKAMAEKLDPTVENEYWSTEYRTRPYYDPQYDYQSDYGPAFAFGASTRAELGDRNWDESLEGDLRQRWSEARGSSRLEWEDAQGPVKDAWDRSDRTYRASGEADRYYAGQFDQAPYRDTGASFDDYRQAYRFGTAARTQYPDQPWENAEPNLARRWDSVKGDSRLTWDEAKAAVKDAWHNVERLLPGDADRDGR